MEPKLHEDSPSWIFFVHAAFVIALAAMVIGIWLLPDALWIKGYLAMGLFFTVSSTITLSKTVRDNHEAKKLYRQIAEVKTEQLLKEMNRV